MNKLKLFLLTTSSLLLAAACVTAQEANLQQGKVVYDHWCAPCHAQGDNHPGTMALNAKYQGAIPGYLLERSDITPELIKTFVRTGVSIMPFFRKTEISDAELEDLAAYMVSESKK